ncbi:MAG: anti-sigma factor [Hyphomonadaceae bacterium]
MNEERILAYVDGELPPTEAAEMEAALARDPALAARVAKERALRAMLSRTYDPIADAPVPERLTQAARSEAPSNVVNFQRARERRTSGWGVREWGAMAASLAGGLIIGFGALNANPPLIESRGSQMEARGALARALDQQLAADGAQGGVSIGLTFRARDGQHCRTFNAREIAGLACREGDAWRVETAVAHRAQAGDVRTASTDIPASVLSAADAMIEGETFDAEAERRARDAGWR